MTLERPGEEMFNVSWNAENGCSSQPGDLLLPKDPGSAQISRIYVLLPAVPFPLKPGTLFLDHKTLPYE